MPVLAGDTVYYAFPRWPVVDSAGELLASETASAVTKVGGSAASLREPGSLVVVSDVTTNPHGVAPALLADAPQLAVTFGGDAFIITSSEVQALADGVGVGGYPVTIGDGSTSAFVIVHGLNSLDVLVQVYQLADGATILPAVRRLDVDRVLVDFGITPPPTDSMRVLIQSVPSTVEVTES